MSDQEQIPTTHRMVVVIDPRSSLEVFATSEGLIVRLDAKPERIGRAALGWLRTARRIAENEADEGIVPEPPAPRAPSPDS